MTLGLAQDANEPYGVEKTENGDLVPISDINISSRESGMLINTLLIILGFLDIIFSLPSVILCLRELCDCYDPRYILSLCYQHNFSILEFPACLFYISCLFILYFLPVYFILPFCSFYISCLFIFYISCLFILYFLPVYLIFPACFFYISCLFI